jgi:GT2 family glycosyltransferase
MTTLSALVVTWNSGRRLAGLLDSLAAQGVELELVQVDNASSDDSVAVGRRWQGPLRQIENTQNLGYAAALKQAFDAASGEALLVINADVRLEQGALRTLLDCLSAGERIGAVGPKLLDDDGVVQPTSARRLPTGFSTVVHSLGLRRLVEGTRLDPYTYPAGTYDTERDVPAISGAAMLIRRSALAAVGGVDARWFMYYEDLDICARLTAGGWRIRYCPRAVGRHEGAASSPRTPELETWLAVQLDAAVNLFLHEHRTPTAPAAHRVAAAVGGALRTVSRSAPARRRGVATLRWALLNRMPGGGPAR